MHTLIFLEDTSIERKVISIVQLVISIKEFNSNLKMLAFITTGVLLLKKSGTTQKPLKITKDILS